MELPNQEFGELIRFVNKGREDKAKKIYEDKEPKGKEEIGKCEAPAKKVGRPLTDPKVLAKAVLTCEALDLDLPPKNDMQLSTLEKTTKVM